MTDKLVVLVDRDMELTEHTEPGDDTLAALQKHVDGTIAVAFTIPSPVPGRELTGYVHDEGLLLRLPLRNVVVHPGGYATPLAGPMVLSAVDERDGETVSLLPEEIAYLKRFRTVVRMPTVVQGILMIDYALYRFDTYSQHDDE